MREREKRELKSYTLNDCHLLIKYFSDKDITVMLTTVRFSQKCSLPVSHLQLFCKGLFTLTGKLTQAHFIPFVLLCHCINESVNECTISALQ